MNNGYGQFVFAGDGDDLVDLGSNWDETVAYGGRGNDTFNLPVEGSTMVVYGGDGDDVFDTDREQDMAAVLQSVALYGDAGNDKMTLLEFAMNMYGYGGTGDDKIVHFNNDVLMVEGNDGNDIIYGSDNVDAMTDPPTMQKIYGDESFTSI